MKNEFQRGNFEAKIKDGKLQLKSTCYYKKHCKNKPEKEVIDCDVTICRYQGTDTYLVHIGRLCCKVTDKQYDSLLAFFNSLSASSEDLSGEHVLFGKYMEVVDDYRVGLYFYQDTIVGYTLLDRHFLSHIAEFLHDNNPFKKVNA